MSFNRDGRSRRAVLALLGSGFTALSGCAAVLPGPECNLSPVGLSLENETEFRIRPRVEITYRGEHVFTVERVLRSGKHFSTDAFDIGCTFPATARVSVKPGYLKETVKTVTINHPGDENNKVSITIDFFPAHVEVDVERVRVMA